LKNNTTKQLEKVEFEIIKRPMKVLDWKTPYEFMMGEIVSLVNCSQKE
jgi:IS30 family transposase